MTWIVRRPSLRHSPSPRGRMEYQFRESRKAPDPELGRVIFMAGEQEKQASVTKKIEEAIERERERRRVFINGFFWGAAVLFFLFQIVRSFTPRDEEGHTKSSELSTIGSC